MPDCDLRVRWKVASDLRSRAAISEPESPSFCRISVNLAQSTRKSLAIAIVRFWCAKNINLGIVSGLGGWQKFVHAFWGSFLMGEKNTETKSPENPGTIP